MADKYLSDMFLSPRSLLRQLADGATYLGIGGGNILRRLAPHHVELKGNINHSVSRRSFSNHPLDAFCSYVKRLGIGSVELLEPREFDVVLQHDLTCAMVNAPTPIETGFNHLAHHEELIAAYEQRITKVANAGFPNLLCFSGNRNGLSNEEGIENCVRGIQQLIRVAEENDVTLCMKIQSKQTHPDYHFDNMAFGAEVAERICSEHFGILYDLTQSQSMADDLIQTIRKHSDIIKHYHTGGVPGRTETDDATAIDYPAVMEAIKQTGFEGWIGHDFPSTGGDAFDALERAIELCDV